MVMVMVMVMVMICFFLKFESPECCCKEAGSEPNKSQEGFGKLKRHLIKINDDDDDGI